MSKLDKLEAEKWRLAQAMDDAKDLQTSFVVMMHLNQVMMSIYYEEMRLSGKTKAQAKKELLTTLEGTDMRYKEQIKAIA
jgi:hypothetical protein